MIVVHVFVKVKEGQIEAFKAASVENAAASLNEPGIARFDMAQQADDPARFVFVEAFVDKKAMALHKETAHIAKWRKVAGPMIDEKHSVKYESVFPE